MRQAGAYSGILCGGRNKNVPPHSLPLARIKKIMKRSGEDVKMISGEAPIVFSKACELFIEEITQRSWMMTIQAKRRTLHKDDVASAIIATDIFDFLLSLVPPPPPPSSSSNNSNVDVVIGGDDDHKEKRIYYGKQETKKVDATSVPKESENSVLGRVETEKRLAIIKAWEENEKAKVENKAHKKISAIGSWDNKKKASVEAQIKVYEKKLETKKAEFVEKMKNRAAEIRKEADGKKARIEAQKKEEVHKVEESAENFRKTRILPKKFFSCFSYQ